MFEILQAYWPHILAVLSILLGVPAAIHAAMTKEEVRSAIGWVGVIVLSPLLGATIYYIVGINRMRRQNVNLQRRQMSDIERFHLSDYDVPVERVYDEFGKPLSAMKILGDRISRCCLTSGNTIEMFENGDDAYQAMLDAINKAENSILMETYIFDRDDVGLEFVKALSQAVERGVAVRVLIDAVGARYSIPSIVRDLRTHNIKVDVFNGGIIMGLRLPYANLRTHRKILVIDGKAAFTGGLNIRAGFSNYLSKDKASKDTHFRVTGPVVSDLFYAASEDWRFTTNEMLTGEQWVINKPKLDSSQGSMIRVVPSGPDKSLETNHRMLMGAFSVAQDTIRIMTPYLLPDRELIGSLVTAARRGVRVDIVVPGNNNLKLVDRAMRAQFDQLLRDKCHIWRAKGTFNHSKLISIDGAWAYVGSSNLDPRSLRLNFEIDMEVFDRQFAIKIENRIRQSLEKAEQVDLTALKKRAFPKHLLDRLIWLGSPYL